MSAADVLREMVNMGEADETIGDSSVHVIRGGGVCVGAG